MLTFNFDTPHCFCCLQEREEFALEIFADCDCRHCDGVERYWICATCKAYIEEICADESYIIRGEIPPPMEITIIAPETSGLVINDSILGEYF